MIIFIWLIGLVCAGTGHPGWGYFLLSICIYQLIDAVEEQIKNERRHQPTVTIGRNPSF